MRVYAEATAWNDIERSGWIEYEGPVSLKGEGAAKTQLDRENALTDKAFNAMMDRQNQVLGGVGKYTQGAGEGYDPQQLDILRAQFLNQNAMNYNQAGKNVVSALARRGSYNSAAPVGGDYTRGIASLEGAAASDRSSGLANIDLSNLQQALTNRFNAASLINGQAAQLTSPISTFGSGASNALNQYVWASNQGFGASFMKSLGGELGSGLAAGAVGGLGGALPSSGFATGFNKGIGG